MLLHPHSVSRFGGFHGFQNASFSLVSILISGHQSNGSLGYIYFTIIKRRQLLHFQMVYSILNDRNPLNLEVIKRSNAKNIVMQIKSLFIALSIGCLGNINAQALIEGRMNHDGLNRQYLMYLPGSYERMATLPLLVILHGGSGSAATTVNFTQMNPVADQNDFIVLYPQGIAPSLNGGFTWADGRGTAADRMGINDVDFLIELIEHLSNSYKIDPKRLFLTGFSNGSFMTQRMACEKNELFAAMASLGSTIDTVQFNRCTPNRPIPMLILTGTADPFVPYHGGSMQGNVPDIISTASLVDFWVTNNNCRTTIDSLNLPDNQLDDESTVTTFEFTSCLCDANVIHYRINNGGHTWPGVEIPNYEQIAGPTNEDINASQEIWNFFSQFSLCSRLTSTTSNGNTINEQVAIFPNPVRDYIQVNATEPIISYHIYNSNGSEVMTGKMTSSIPIDLPNGLYAIRLGFRNGDAKTMVFVIQKI